MRSRWRFNGITFSHGPKCNRNFPRTRLLAHNMLFPEEFDLSVSKNQAAKAKGQGTFIDHAQALLPGVGLSALVALISLGAQHLEERVFGHPYIEGLVIAIVLGMAIRTAWEPDSRWRAGIAFSAKQVLEVAVALLGASISFSAIAASGFSLLAATVGTVAIMLAASYGIGRLLGLPVRLAILVACGNSVCGNSAIAAIAP